MLFYLDKELAKQGIAKCIAVSEKEISQEELEARKKCFNIQEILIYEGIDIPHKFKYNESLDNIEELIELEEIAPRMLSEEIQEVESDFDEEVEVDPEKQYFYLDKAYADKFNKSQVIAVFPKPLKNPNQYFQKEVYSHFGKDIPFYISIDEGNIIREATEYEKYQRGQRKLQDREVAFQNEIIYLEEGWYIEGEELIKVPKPKGVKLEFNEETHKWVELATEEETTEYIGVLVTNLLYKALSIGCEVTIKDEKHQQILTDEKRRALLEKVLGIDLKAASEKELSVVAWPFKDDGTDTVIMSVEDFRTMALYCFDYGDNCYIAAELLKAKRKVDSTLDDFYAELANVDTISLENL